jgi:hypothetical protein
LGVENKSRVRFADVIPAMESKNLVPNGSFETGSAGWSSMGKGVGYLNDWMPITSNWGNFESLHGQVEKNGAAHGEAFLRIRLGGENTPVFNFDYFYPVNRRELRPLAASLGWIELTPGVPYTISLSMRASCEGIRGAFGVWNDDAGDDLSDSEAEILTHVTLTHEWRRYSLTFVAKHPYVFVLAGPDLTQERDVAVDIDAIQLEKGTQGTRFSPRADLEVEIAPTAFAGVFTVGQPVSLRIAASNNSGRITYARFHFKVTDYYNQPVELNEGDLEIPPWGTAEKTILVPPHWRGFYRIQPTCSSGDLTVKPRLLRLAIVPPRSSSDTILGINHAYPTKNLLTLAREAGITWYRDWSLKWQQVEPERGKYNWGPVDLQFNRMAAQSLNLMAMIPFPSAEWNSTAPDLGTIRALTPNHSRKTKSEDREPLLRARWDWMPMDLGELKGFLSPVVSRYGKQIQALEILNEPLSTRYLFPSEQTLKSKELEAFAVQNYLDLLGSVVPVIRAANPSIRIVGGGIFPDGVTQSDHAGESSPFEILSMGLLDFLDVVSLHDFPGMPLRHGGKIHMPEELISAMNPLRAIFMAHCRSMPLWMTEFSYYGSDDLPRSHLSPTLARGLSRSC